MLIETTERAMAHCGQNEVLIVGGVGCNEVFFFFNLGMERLSIILVYFYYFFLLIF